MTSGFITVYFYFPFHAFKVFFIFPFAYCYEFFKRIGLFLAQLDGGIFINIKMKLELERI